MFSKTWSALLVVYLFSDFSQGQKDNNFFREDYTYLETTEGFYKIHTIPQTWAEAKQVCDLEGASLFYPDNRDEANAVISLLKTTKPEIPLILIGLSDITSKGKFETVDGKSVCEVYNQWAKGEPNNNGGHEDCVLLFLNGELNDYPCGDKMNFICKKSLQTLERDYNCNLTNSDGQRDKKFLREDYSYLETMEGFYKIHTIPQTWAEAKQACALEGATLFYPDNRDEANAVISFWKRTQPKIIEVFIGLSDITCEGQFETVGGKLIAKVYNQWKKGEPNNEGGNEDCGQLDVDGNLSDKSCDKKFNFICKKSLLTLERKYNCKFNSGGQRDEKFFRKDYTYLETVEGFYKFHSKPRQWADAKHVCALEGTSLFYPENDDEAQAVISFWNETQPCTSSVYLGLSKSYITGEFETPDGKPISKVYNNWGPAQRIEDTSDDVCVILDNVGYLDDTRCNNLKPFICEKSRQSVKWNYNCNMSNLDYYFNENLGKCYKLHTTPLNWKDAYVTCRAEQSYLAVIDTPAEAEYLAELTKSAPNLGVQELYQRGIYHLGFHSKFKRSWWTITGKSLNDASFWWGNQTPSANDEKKCGSMFYTGRLNNINCDTKSLFICEYDADVNVEFTNEEDQE